MKIGGYQPVSLCDFVRRISTVVFTQGCNFRCPFCHNAQLLPMSVPVKNLIPEQDVLGWLERRRGQIDAVVISGGEPTLQRDLPQFLRAVREYGFEIKLDTNGSRPDVLRDLIGARLVDYVAMDVKAPLQKYQELAGVPVSAETILESIRILTDSRLPHEFRTTLVPKLLTQMDIVAIRSILPATSVYKTQPYRPVRQAARSSSQPAGIPL